MRVIYTVLVGKNEGKRPFVRARKWYDNIKMNLLEVECGDRWRTLVNGVMNLWVP
jgi:hypothetical protein